MELGVVAWLTDLDVGIDELAPAVEQAGLESLFLSGHTHVPASRRDLLDDDYHNDDARLLDQFIVLGAAAVLTTRLKLATGACIVPHYDPIVLAKQVVTIDHLSGGRFLFGVGAGWLIEEMQNHGVEPRLRWQLMQERIEAMKRIWTQDQAEFHGEFVDFDPIWLWPKPVQKPHPPVLVGMHGGRGVRAALDYGDAWMPVLTDLPEFETSLSELHRLCDDAGRDRMDVTALSFDLDETVMARCVELGVARVAVLAPTKDRSALRSFLARCARIVSSGELEGRAEGSNR
jgi:probable F420-dependent oxidoreductase